MCEHDSSIVGWNGGTLGAERVEGGIVERFLIGCCDV